MIDATQLASASAGEQRPHKRLRHAVTVHSLVVETTVVETEQLKNLGFHSTIQKLAGWLLDPRSGETRLAQRKKWPFWGQQGRF